MPLSMAILSFSADAVIRGDENRIGKARGLQVKEPAKAADFRIGAAAGGSRAHAA